MVEVAGTARLLGAQPSAPRYNLGAAAGRECSGGGLAWLDDFNPGDWPQDVLRAVSQLGEVTAATWGDLWVLLQTPQTDAAGQPNGWRYLAWLEGPSRGYWLHHETSICVIFGASDVVLDFAEFESSEVTGDDELQNLVLTMEFKGLRGPHRGAGVAHGADNPVSVASNPKLGESW
jgi:hypothetical protein